MTTEFLSISKTTFVELGEDMQTRLDLADV